MKYPKEQFEELVKGLNKLSPFIDLKEANPHTLHYMVAQQYMTEGQPHNQIYVKEGTAARAHGIENFEGWEKLIDSKFDFKLYPDGCNDTHVLTATKKALKEVMK